MAYVLISAFDDVRVVNELVIPREVIRQVSAGTYEVCKRIANKVRVVLRRKEKVIICMDSYIGFDWEYFIPKLTNVLREEGLSITLHNILEAYKDPAEIIAIEKPYLDCDPYFGRIFENSLEVFFNIKKLYKLKEALMKGNEVSICYGYGSATEYLTEMYDIIVYIDVTKEKAGRAIVSGLLSNLGDRKVTGDSKTRGKRLYYVDFPVMDRHKRSIALKQMHFYVDGNNIDCLKLLSRDAYKQVLKALSRHPLRLKPIYLEGVWGGRWLKTIRSLPSNMRNCAWSYEVMAPYQSLYVKLEHVIFELPFLNLLWEYPKEVMGEFEALDKVRGHFPIRVNYDDSMGGGDMAIQVHGDLSYLRENFNEPMGQNESYYIVAAGPGAKTYLGLKEQVDVDGFYRVALRAEKEGVPFDHNRFVHSIPSREGDLFLIPAGTVHASGRNQVVLEISDTTDLYTFHIYDYLRPDLNGKLRPIHTYHAFKVLNPSRKARWVEENLRAKPRPVRMGDTWVEYFLGELGELGILIHRLEFLNRISDNTNNRFHILILVGGEKVKIVPKRDPARSAKIEFSETALIPACIGEYELVNLGKSPCKVVKAFMR